jgi:peroxin-2
MPAADFAAAQARLAARRQEIERQRTTRQTSREASLPTSKLPFPFRNIGDASLSLWDSIRGREGTRPAFRVGQVDAELLDEELLDLLKGQVGEGLKYHGVSNC